MIKSALFGVVTILSCSLVAQSLPDSAKPAQPGKIYHVGGDVKGTSGNLVASACRRQ